MRYGFLLSRRWLGIAVLAVLVAAVCVLLGTWQLSRHEYRAEQIALVAANAEQAPVPITDLLSSPSEPLPADDEWRSVAVTGSYVGTPVALPQRGIEDAAADHALALLAVDLPDGGTWLLAVDRGWYPTDAFIDPGDRLELPEGEVSLVVRLRPAEPASDRVAITGQVFRIAPAQVADAAAPGADLAGSLVTGAYGSLVSETPTTANPPTPLPIPAPNYRSNLSYAFQWWTFALMALVGLGVMARRERAALDHDAGAPAPTPRLRRRSDAEAEDAEIEDAEIEQTGSARQASDTSSV